ncbi:hypothetical protein ACJX0J_038208, partial [Zea mays]
PIILSLPVCLHLTGILVFEKKKWQGIIYNGKTKEEEGAAHPVETCWLPGFGGWKRYTMFSVAEQQQVKPDWD